MKKIFLTLTLLSFVGVRASENREIVTIKYTIKSGKNCSKEIISNNKKSFGVGSGMFISGSGSGSGSGGSYGSKVYGESNSLTQTNVIYSEATCSFKDDSKFLGFLKSDNVVEDEKDEKITYMLPDNVLFNTQNLAANVVCIENKERPSLNSAEVCDILLYAQLNNDFVLEEDDITFLITRFIKSAIKDLSSSNEGFLYNNPIMKNYVDVATIVVKDFFIEPEDGDSNEEIVTIDAQVEQFNLAIDNAKNMSEVIKIAKACEKEISKREKAKKVTEEDENLDFFENNTKKKGFKVNGKVLVGGAFGGAFLVYLTGLLFTSKGWMPNWMPINFNSPISLNSSENQNLN